MTEASLEKRLRFVLDCSVIASKRRPSKKSGFANVEPDGGAFRILLPTKDKNGKAADDDYLLRYLLHELCHVAIPGELWAFGSFEEDILERVIEPRMMDHLLNNPDKHEWWLKRLKQAREA